jgi:hydroxymethylbilane synthase
MSFAQVATPRIFSPDHQVFDKSYITTDSSKPVHHNDTKNPVSLSQSTTSTASPVISATSNTPERDPSMIIYKDFVNPAHTKDQTITVGGRKSILAIVQSKNIAGMLSSVNPDNSFPVVALSTLGDKVLSKPLYSFGGKSLWTKELETLLLHNIEDLPKLDLIVHSLKDMPTSLPDGCVLGAITKREDPRDALIMPTGSSAVTLSDLAPGSVVGTSSIRRSAQLKRNYPHLRFESIRGNVQTRLAKLDAPDSQFSCIILAVAGLNRLGLGERITSCLDAPDMYYAVGQGALGIEIRTGDERIIKLLEDINDNETYLQCLAERSLMRTLEGGCSVPIGVRTRFTSEHTMEFVAIVVSVDGTEAVKETISATVTCAAEADDLGKKLAHKLIENGAKDILDAIHLDAVH